MSAVEGEQVDVIEAEELIDRSNVARNFAGSASGLTFVWTMSRSRGSVGQDLPELLLARAVPSRGLRYDRCQARALRSMHASGLRWLAGEMGSLSFQDCWYRILRTKGQAS